ncbi:hypothetical protein J6U78_03810 [bacterium]|nr:hypothetical protein [bacterium]
MKEKTAIENLLALAPAVIPEELLRRDVIAQPSEYVKSYGLGESVCAFASLLAKAYEKENTTDAAGPYKLIKSYFKWWLKDHHRGGANYYITSKENIYYTGQQIFIDKTKKEYKGLPVVPASKMEPYDQEVYKDRGEQIQKMVKDFDAACSMPLDVPAVSAVAAIEGNVAPLGSYKVNKNYLLTILRAIPGCQILGMPAPKWGAIKFYNDSAAAYLMPLRF